MSAPATEVLEAAAELVRCFGEGRRDDYFACFAPEATFAFYNAPAVFESRSAYEAAYDEWVADGWRVDSCASEGGRVTLVGEDVAVFTHDVATEITTAAGPESLAERETIVFRREGVRWVAVHEHLSTRP